MFEWPFAPPVAVSPEYARRESWIDQSSLKFECPLCACENVRVPKGTAIVVELAKIQARLRNDICSVRGITRRSKSQPHQGSALALRCKKRGICDSNQFRPP
jgi:hypothetical protein